MNTMMTGMENRSELPPLFRNEQVEILGVQVNMDGWESPAERGAYRQKAEHLLGLYRYDLNDLNRVRMDLDAWVELTWNDVFDPTDVLHGVSFDKERVQTSNISDEPYQIYAAAETKLERNQREKTYLERELQECQKRVDTGKQLLNLLQGNTKKVAGYLWFEEEQPTWEAIAAKVDISYRSVGNERDRAIEIIALYIKRSDYRTVRLWFL